jgi:hypothetical protein
LKSVPATQFRAGRQQAATSRARAPRVALGPPPETLLPHVRASPSPGASLDAVRRRVRAVRAERATDRSDSVAAAVRAATEDGYHGGFFVVSAPSSSSTYLRAARSRARQPSCHPRRAARHCRRRLELAPSLALAAGQPLH